MNVMSAVVWKTGINVLGALPRRGDLVLPERHLGLVQAVEHEDLDKAIVDYANFVEDHIDIAKLVGWLTHLSFLNIKINSWSHLPKG